MDVDVKSSDCLKIQDRLHRRDARLRRHWGHLHIHLKQGLQHLNGEQAVAYMRFRHDWCSDPCRIMRQQQVLHAMATKLRGDKVNTFMHLGDLLAVFRKYVQTDFSDQELLAIAAHYQGIADNAIVNNQVPYTDDIDLAGIRRLAAARRRSARAAGQCDAARAAGTRAVARCDGAGGDRARERCAWTSRTAAASAAPAGASPTRCAKRDLRSADVGNAPRSDYVDERNPRAFDRVVCRCERARGAAGGDAEGRGGSGPVAAGGSADPEASPTTSDVTVIVGDDLAKVRRPRRRAGDSAVMFESDA